MTDIPDAESEAVTALCSEIELLRARLTLARVETRICLPPRVRPSPPTRTWSPTRCST